MKNILVICLFAFFLAQNVSSQPLSGEKKYNTEESKTPAGKIALKEVALAAIHDLPQMANLFLSNKKTVSAFFLNEVITRTFGWADEDTTRKIVEDLLNQLSDDPNAFTSAYVKAFFYLEAAMDKDPDKTFMRNDLFRRGLLPLTPNGPGGPFERNYPQQEKWVKTDDEVVIHTPQYVIDMYKPVCYFQMELRRDNMDYPTDQSARYGIVLPDGQTRDIYGNKSIRFERLTEGNWYIIQHEPSSLSIGSSTMVTLSPQGFIEWDFTTGEDKYYHNNQPKSKSPATEVRPGIWGMWARDCSGNNYNDFTDAVMIENLLNHYQIFHPADINLSGDILDDDWIFSFTAMFIGSHIPFIHHTGDHINNPIVFNPLFPQYILTAGCFSKVADTISYSLHIIRTGDDSLLFERGQFMLDINTDVSNIKSVRLDRSLSDSVFLNLAGHTIQLGMITHEDTPVINTGLGTELCRVNVVFKPGTAPPLTNTLFNWHTTGMGVTKIFATISGFITDITNPANHRIDSVLTGIGKNNVSILDYSLSQNYPNPFNPTTQINFSLPKAERVVLRLYDVTGREVVTLLNEYKASGNYSIPFNGTSLSSGIYFYKLEAGDFVETKKMTLIK